MEGAAANLLRKYVKLTTGGAPLPRIVNKQREETRPKTKASNDQRRRRRRKVTEMIWLVAAPISRGQRKWSMQW